MAKSASEKYLSIEDIEQSEKIDVIDFNDLEGLERKFNKNNITIIPPRNNFLKKSKYSPEKFRALLFKGSLIESIETKKTYKSDRDLFVLAQQKTQGDNFSYLLNRDGKWVYRTRTINLNSIEKDVELGYKNIKGSDTYKKTFQHNVQDSNLKLTNRFSFSLEALQANLFEELFNNEGIGLATARRIEWRTFYKWHIPLEFGLSAAYQSGNYYDGFATWDTIYFGPLIKYPLINSEHMLTSISSGVQKSAKFKVFSNGKEMALTSLTWHIDIETMFKTKWGNWILGLEYRDQNTGIQEDNIGLSLNSGRKEKIKSFGFVIGREFDITL